jgi:predicted RNA-binding protein YlxR (DUF448 family)
MREKGHVPIRMCIGCRKKRQKEEMIRFTQSTEGVLWIDERKRHQGRGFYLCPNLDCLNIAKKKGKGAGLLGTVGSSSSSIEAFLKSRKIGIEEKGNDKE